MHSDIDRIDNRIKIMGLKKTYIANRIGISNQYLSYILNGKRNLTPEIKTKLFTLLGL